MSLAVKLYVFLLIAIDIGLCSACNGHKIRVVRIENCGNSEQVMKVDTNFTISLTRECEIVIKGCGETTGFRTAKAKYTLYRNSNRIISGTYDVCDTFNSKGMENDILRSFNMSASCPIKKMRTCSDGTQTINVAKYKPIWPYAIGNLDVNIRINHDSGNSCMHYTAIVSKE
ncbi:uncharacterized protein LOC116340586 [Contarinia nasturtii]|uniref:uncharacterized protein LOC116340586 n=1 Tax=Contarinia nasturtii TaxID=265458 RepID=UPI0012D39307|nr:uncharacterized protein LOC116340586 [Contarinia nasturtii]